ncbi:hypothetical protein ACFFX0_33175 [Citricoccus parietis]|uniref:Uncharacterized protein n=1 Tax=Citricoccus parietis TaxID=592307 RepID=A0ABV5G9Y9_9MICC
MPSLISGWPNFALSAARMMSAIIANSQPPPSACPATAEMIGVRRAVNRSQMPKMSAGIGLGEAKGGHLLDVGPGRERPSPSR